jgi:alpha-tubulin suppressor-like RCC1 family protein
MSLRRPNGFISAGYDPLEVPNAPTIGVATSAGPTAVSVTFTAPSNVGGSAITGYVATAKKTSDGTTISGTGSSSPVTISGLTTGDAYTVTVAAVNSFGLGVSSAASNSVTPMEMQLFSWGRNSTGTLGLGNTDNRSSPVQVGALTTWSQIAAGEYHAVSSKTDGTLWSWGSGAEGRLGQNSTIYRSSPVQIGSLTSWGKVAAGRDFSAAVKIDGTLWSWGRNNLYGTLGLNDVVNRSSPVQVGGLTNWSQVSAGQNFCLAIKTDGTLWSWGVNSAGQLAQNNTTDRSSPVQIGSLSNWAMVTCGQVHAAAIKTDGTLWSWGSNYIGQLGIGSGYGTNRSSPTQVGSLTGWSSVGCGARVTLAVKTDGTLWAWGRNDLGLLGLNDTAARSSPVQVGALTNWAKTAGGYVHSVATKTDGTFWSWGFNSNGELGQNNTTSLSSPVQVGALATWQTVAPMPTGRSTFAIKG